MSGPDPGCPYCGDLHGPARVVCESARVDAWRCGACGGMWWCSVVNPDRFLHALAGDVLWRDVTALADAAPGLTDEQLRVQALTLLIKVAQHAKGR